MRAVCPACQFALGRKAPCLRSLLELIWLYFIGVFELLRQALQHMLHASRFLPNSEIAAVTQTNEKVGDRLEHITILTGATSGIGLELRRKLYRRGSRLIVLSHPSEAGSCPEHEEILVDFNCPGATKLAAMQVRDTLSRTSSYSSALLFHCAGVYNPVVKEREFQSHGVLETYTVNTVMPALFLQLLGDLISGFIYMGSASQKIAPVPSPRACLFCIAKSPHGAYPLSKMLMFAFVERWSETEKKPAIIIHPGVVRTQLYRNVRGLMGIILQALLKLSALDADESARRVLQILDEALFFQTMRTQGSTGNDSNPTAIFWDAATMRPAEIPWQISSTKLREQIYQEVGDVSARWRQS